MLSWWQRLTGNRAAEQTEAFFNRFTGRTLILHAGLPAWWTGELTALAGGGAHLRLDVRQIGDTRPTPVEWMARQHILPQNPPLPLLVRVEQQQVLRIRHLQSGNNLLHPSDLWWILQEFDQRWHFRIQVLAEGCQVDNGIALHDNDLDYTSILADGECAPD